MERLDPFRFFSLCESWGKNKPVGGETKRNQSKKNRTKVVGRKKPWTQSNQLLHLLLTEQLVGLHPPLPSGFLSVFFVPSLHPIAHFHLVTIDYNHKINDTDKVNPLKKKLWKWRSTLWKWQLSHQSNSAAMAPLFCHTWCHPNFVLILSCLYISSKVFY